MLLLSSKYSLPSSSCLFLNALHCFQVHDFYILSRVYSHYQWVGSSDKSYSTINRIGLPWLGAARVDSIQLVAIFGENERKLEAMYMISNHTCVGVRVCMCVAEANLPTKFSTEELLYLRA